MPQICPSSSHQLAAAALAFHRARRKFPKDLGSFACSGDAARIPLNVCSAIVKDNVPGVSNVLSYPKQDNTSKTDRPFSSNQRGRRNYASYQSPSSSRTASRLSSDCRRDTKGRVISSLNVTRLEVARAAHSKRQSCSHAKKCGVYDLRKDQEQETRVEGIAGGSQTSTVISDRICSKMKPVESRESNQSHFETASKSTHSSVGSKKRRNARDRRTCIHAGRIRRSASRSSPKIRDPKQISCLHAYPGTKERSFTPREPQTVEYYNRKASTVRNEGVMELPDKTCSSDSPTAADFPTKLQTWEHRTRQGFWREDNRRRGRMLSCECPNEQKSCFRDQSTNLLRNRQVLHKSHSHPKETSIKKPQKLDSSAEICLRPSLIKAAQQKVDSGVRERSKRYRNYGFCGRLSKNSDVKSTWDENLNVIKHKDSMSLLMDRFKGNNQRHNLKLQNISELNFVLGSKTSYGQGDPLLRSEKIQQATDSATNQALRQTFDDTGSVETSDYPPRKSSSRVNPVTKLGRVANQAIRENEGGFKNVRSRLNKSGLCCSSKETSRRRAL